MLREQFINRSEQIATIGDRVLYTGDWSHADTYTQTLMKKYLNDFDLYKVCRVSFNVKSKMYYYIFYDLSAKSFWYPSECFTLNFVQYIKNKYNLK